MAESFGSEIPRILAEKLGDGAEDAALHHHLLMKFVVAGQLRHPLDGKPIQDDAALGHDNPPAIHGPPVAQLRGEARDFKTHIREFGWPDVAKVFRG